MSNENNTEHSMFAPSSAYRWSFCPGSIHDSVGLPDMESEAAKEGTLAHAVAEHILQQKTGLEESVFEKLLKIYKNGGLTVRDQFINTDMITHVMTYVDAVHAEITSGVLYKSIEETLDLSKVLGICDQKGTGDCVIVTTDGELQIHDLKYGRIRVYATENDQLILYALGALDSLGALVSSVKSIRLFIHQPRLYHISEWELPLNDVTKYKDKYCKAAQTAYNLVRDESNVDLDPKFYVPGEKQCKYCPVGATCVAYRDYVKQSITGDANDTVDNDTIKTQISATTDIYKNRETDKIRTSYVAESLSRIPLIRAWCNTVESYAMSQLLAGNSVTGWKLIKGRKGNKKWMDVEGVETFIKNKRLGKILFERKPISPSKAEKALSERPNVWSNLRKLIKEGETSPSMVTEDTQGVPWFEQVKTSEFDDVKVLKKDVKPERKPARKTIVDRMRVTNDVNTTLKTHEELTCGDQTVSAEALCGKVKTVDVPPVDANYRKEEKQDDVDSFGLY